MIDITTERYLGGPILYHMCPCVMSMSMKGVRGYIECPIKESQKQLGLFQKVVALLIIVSFRKHARIVGISHFQTQPDDPKMKNRQNIPCVQMN